MGILYIVSTPIGNLNDITLRAMDLLSRVLFVACEDTRRTGLLLQKLIKRPTDQQLISYYEQNEKQRIPQVISVLKQGFDVALVSDAGTPLISDPGFKLVRQARQEGIKVEPIPGASSVLTALVSSGLPTDKFMFVGYPPHKSGHRLTFFKNIKAIQEFIKQTVVFFEAPHKLKTTLTDLQAVFGDIDIVLARELTKLHEESLQIKLTDAVNHYTKKTPKGEYVVLFHL